MDMYTQKHIVTSDCAKSLFSRLCKGLPSELLGDVLAVEGKKTTREIQACLQQYLVRNPESFVDCILNLKNSHTLEMWFYYVVESDVKVALAPYNVYFDEEYPLAIADAIAEEPARYPSELFTVQKPTGFLGMALRRWIGV
jgi:hypothetical protein